MNYLKNNKSRQRLLILIDADFVGGAEVNYRFIIPELRNNGIEPILVAPGKEKLHAYFSTFIEPPKILPVFKTYYSFSHKNRVSPLNILRSFHILISNRRILLRLISFHTPIAVISTGMVSHWLLALCSQSNQTKYIVHLGDIVDRNKAFNLYGKGLDWIVSRVDSVVSISEAVSETISQKLRKKVSKIYLPISNAQHKIQNKKNTIRIGMFARYTQWKGHLDLLKIASYCLSNKVHFVCFGNIGKDESPYYFDLVKSAKRIGSEDFIKLNSFVSDIMKEMASCDVILHLSRQPEPFGRILLEANSSSTPPPL